MLSTKSKLVVSTFSLLFLSILIHVIAQSAEALPQSLQLIAYASLPIIGGLITLGFCSLLRTFANIENLATSRLLRVIPEAQASDFFIGFLVTSYLSLIRPPLGAYVLFLPYVEWVAVVLAVYVIYTMIGSSTKDFDVSPEGLGWKEHIQEIRRETGRDLIRITSVMEQFVDNGVKEPLLVYLTLHLQRLGETEEDILKTLSPLIDYQDNAQRHKLYFLAFPWTRRKLAMRDKKARENLLNTLLEKINRL